MKFKTLIMDGMAVERAVKRISHEIIERNNGIENVVLVGIKTRGVPLAKILRDNILSLEGVSLPVEELDITLYRDDLSELSETPAVSDNISTDLKGKKVILCDDVLYTGRTVRAAIDAVMKHGRPSSIQLAILIDRGHRELPIRADFVGKNVPTSHEELVAVFFNSTDGETKVELYNKN
ncbi:MAG: bifunctional pyr operon transcriptional regulator/uracil phosphoribosyltransferase PyrR [Clostridia bacterium]|nr:bifunctional pyr operon transcriptional regulator/uracil phosphoribosyltransferase PyrR [Clostridia bacterium]